MKILYHHRIASKDGQFVHVEELTNALRQAGHQIEFVAPQVAEQSDFGGDGGYVARLKQLLPGFLYELLELGYSVLIAIKLVRAILRERPDFIYERYNLFQPAGVIIAKLFRLPLLLEVNAPLYAERARYSGISLHRLARYIEGFTWRHATAVLPVTRVLGDIIASAGVDRSRIHVIHNGINESVRAILEQRRDADDDEIVVGFVGFLNQWHRIDLAINAMAKLDSLNVRLVCVGDGDNNIREELSTLATELGLAERVEFTGLKNRDEVFGYVGRFDIALQPAVTEYASPLKMFEYLAAGCVIVAPRMDNIGEILDDDTALLFEPDNFDDFQARLEYAIANLAELDAMRQSARATIDRRGFTWQRNADRVIDIASSCISVERS